MACSQQLGIFRLQTHVKDYNLLEIVPDPLLSTASGRENTHPSDPVVSTASARQVAVGEVCTHLGQSEKNEDRDVSF